LYTVAVNVSVVVIIIIITIIIKKVKISLLQAMEQIDRGKVVSPRRRPHFTPRFLFFIRFLVLISVRD
jgi:quinol-cytochrome oxidoreductase complex cytochrome b subunit